MANIQKEYLVVLEKGETNWGAYAPDLPGLGVVADSPDEAERRIREGITIYLDEMQEKSDPIPEPVSQVRRVAVAA
jgi:predicted RNase H-like HicB family nuclease